MKGTTRIDDFHSELEESLSLIEMDVAPVITDVTSNKRSANEKLRNTTDRLSLVQLSETLSLAQLDVTPVVKKEKKSLKKTK